MDTVQKFWNEFCEANELDGTEYKDAFQFCVEADWLADLVIEGKKTATTSGYIFYELAKEPLPKEGAYSIVLNGMEKPVAIIQIQSVEVMPMNEVNEEFALAEGEGDYNYWWDAHEKFFRESLKKYNKKFTPDMLVVCERFKKAYPK